MKTIVMGLIGLMWVEMFAHTDINTRFYFDTDKDTLNTQQRSQLQEFIQTALSGKKYREIYVVGYTDADGSNAYNMDLSLRRAKYVTEMLVEKGIPEAMIDKQYKGENLPAATNKTEEGKSLNRRVEVILRTFDIQKSADILYEIKGNPEKIVTIDNSKEVTVTGDKGIRVIFPPNCFVTADNKPIDPKNITIELEEVRTATDALFSGVLSQADNRMPLESGGMFRIKATLNGKELKMKPGTQYSVRLDNKNLKNDMTIFTPAPQPAGLISWTNSKQAFNKDSTFKGNRPSLKLDKSIIENWQLHPRYEGLLESYTFRLPQPPAQNNLPRRPKDVKEPALDGYEYKIPWLKRVFMSKASEEKVRVAMYNHLHDIYKKQHATYLTKLAKYEKDSVLVADKIAKHHEAVELYKHQLAEVAQQLRDFRQALVEHAVISAFKDTKNMLVYKSENNLLQTHDVYEDMNNYIRKLNLYKRYNTVYTIAYKEYAEQYNKACNTNLPDGAPYIYDPEELEPDTYYVDYSTYSTAMLKEDKTVAAHIDQATDKYMQDEVASGFFQAENFSTYYQASLNQFGWVNCDRFYNTPPADMITVQVPDYNIADKNMIALVKSSNSALSMMPVKNGYAVSLPKNEDVVIFAIGLDQNNTPLFAQASFKTDKNVKVDLKFKQAKLSEIKNAINNI